MSDGRIDAVIAEATETLEVLSEIVPSGNKPSEWWDELLAQALPQREPAIRRIEAHALDRALSSLRDLLAVIVALLEEREKEARLLIAGQLHQPECPCAIYEDATLDDIPPDIECICGIETLAHRWKARCVLLRAELARLRPEREAKTERE